LTRRSSCVLLGRRSPQWLQTFSRRLLMLTCQRWLSFRHCRNRMGLIAMAGAMFSENSALRQRDAF
jgi:hypothetical protein